MAQEKERKKHGFLRFLPPTALNKEEAEAPQLKKGLKTHAAPNAVAFDQDGETLLH